MLHQLELYFTVILCFLQGIQGDEASRQIFNYVFINHFNLLNLKTFSSFHAKLEKQNIFIRKFRIPLSRFVLTTKILPHVFFSLGFIIYIFLLLSIYKTTMKTNKLFCNCLSDSHFHFIFICAQTLLSCCFLICVFVISFLERKLYFLWFFIRIID